MRNSIAEQLVLIKGAGDLATGVAARLYCCGFPVAMTELPNPMMVRRTVSFGEAVYDQEVQVEGIRARRVDDAASIRRTLEAGLIPVLVDPETSCLSELSPAVLVDAIMAKHNTGTRITDSSLVVALGPGFTAGLDCHAVIETNRGHRLGRVIHEGSAQPDTGHPGEIGGKTNERILRSPASGPVEGLIDIGQSVVRGQAVARISGVLVVAGLTGVVRGLIRTGTQVVIGTKIGDIDPRADPSHCYLISEKALAIAGGVIEAILSTSARRSKLHFLK